MQIRKISKQDAPPRPKGSKEYEIDQLVDTLEPGQVLELTPDHDETQGSLMMRAANTKKRLAKVGKDVDYYKGPGNVVIVSLLK